MLRWYTVGIQLPTVAVYEVIMRKNKQSIADDIENIKLGKSLKKLRKREKWTQAELGEILGLHQSAVSRLELGLQALNLTHLSAIARFLKCHPMEVMERLSDPSAADSPKS